MSATFPSSPGWNCKPPKWIHRRAPFTVWPIPGRSGMNSNPIAARPKRYL